MAVVVVVGVLVGGQREREREEELTRKAGSIKWSSSQWRDARKRGRQERASVDGRQREREEQERVNEREHGEKGSEPWQAWQARPALGAALVFSAVDHWRPERGAASLMLSRSRSQWLSMPRPGLCLAL